MSHNPEIPCNACHLWHSNAKDFSCKPGRCQKLSEWLLDHAQVEPDENVHMQVIEAPLQYVR